MSTTADEGTPRSRQPAPVKPAKVRHLSRCPGCGGDDLAPELCVLREKALRDGSVLRVTAVGCRTCGLVFASHVPNAEMLARTYSPEGEWGVQESARGRHEGLSPAALQLVARVEAARTTPAAGRPAVLDVGCGRGHFLDAFQHRGYRTAGIEPATSVAFEAHEQLLDVPRERAFDVVLLLHVLEHLVEPFEMLARAASAVCTDGVLVVGVPSLDALPAHRNLRYVINARKHLCAFSTACLTRALAGLGFGPLAVLDTGAETMRLRVLAVRMAAPSAEAVDLLAPFRVFDALAAGA